MPIYEYQCAKCKKVHEIWQKITEAPATKCPSCGGKIERMISASGFALKGTGWYKTDYERKAKSGSKKDKGDSKSDSKPDAKSDSPSSDTAKKDSGSSDTKSQAA